MALIPQEQIKEPAKRASILIIGSSGTGKTSCIATLHRYLRLRGLPTKIAYFDFDQDGAEPVLRCAREGYESITDMRDKKNKIQPWLDDILLYRYYTKSYQMTKDKVTPARDKNLVNEFITDFNGLDARYDANTRTWKPGQELGAIIYDPLTAVQEMYEDFVWSIRNRELGATGTNAVSWADWGLLGEKVRETYMQAKVFPCFFVATAHLDQRLEDVRVPEGQQKLTTGKWFYTSALVKGLAMTIQKDFSVTLFTNEKFGWITSNNEHYRGAKSRGKELPPMIERQDFAEVLDSVTTNNN